MLHRTRPFSRLLECPSCRWRCSCNLLVDPNGLHSIYVSIRCSDTLKSDVAVMNWTTRQTSCDPFDFSLLRSLWRFVFKLPAHVLTDSCSLSLLPLGNICRNYVQNTTTTTAFGTHTNNLFVLRFRQKDTIQEQPATSNNVEHNGHGRVRWGSGSLQFFFSSIVFLLSSAIVNVLCCNYRCCQWIESVPDSPNPSLLLFPCFVGKHPLPLLFLLPPPFPLSPPFPLPPPLTK